MNILKIGQFNAMKFSHLLFTLFLFLFSSFIDVEASPIDQNIELEEHVNHVVKTDFKESDAGVTQFLVYLDNNKMAIDITHDDQSLIIDFQNTLIVKEVLSIKNVVTFSGQVERLEAFNINGKARFILNMKDEYSYASKQLDNLFVIDIFKDKSIKNRASQEKAISLNFQDIPVRNVLQLIADAKGFNLVTSDSVDGNITLRLDEVPWKKALDVILKVKGLGKIQEGNVLMVAPITELIEKESSYDAIVEGTNKDLLHTEFIQINYAKAADIAVMLSAENSHLLSKKGNVNIDARTNILIVQGTVSVLKAIKKMISILDVPVRQVIIEARMVTVNDSVGDKLGIQWGLSGSVGNIATSGTLAGIGSGSDDVSSRLSVNLPIVAAAGNLAFQVGNFANGNILDLQLSALEQENKAEIIARPRITTLNQQTAYIEQGTEIPYVESSSSGATSVSFKKAVLSLEVTPQITPDNKIILELIITQDSKGDTVSTSTGDAVAINTQEISTTVLVENGETLILGGIYQQQVTNFMSKVPLLGDIPYLGYLFRNTSHENSKAELLIFVTPRIVMQTKD